jgi:lipoprotein NlpI
MFGGLCLGRTRCKVRSMKLGLVVALLLSIASGSGAELLDRPEFDFGVLRGQVQTAIGQGRTNEALAMVQREVKERPALFKLRALLGEVHEARREFPEAIKAYTFALDLDPGADLLLQRRGECHFCKGQLVEALADFDALLARNPKDAPEHWQRGIVLYDLGRYAEGRKQFESHQTVNGADCENALWHWLCVARESGTNAAIKAIYPYDESDVRPPMKQLHALYAGKGSVEAVIAASEKNERPNSQSLWDLYARLYLGLYYEAMGDSAKSIEWLKEAVEVAPAGGRMGDVARVHLRLRTQAK